MALLGAVVVRVDLRPKLDLFDDCLGLVLAGFSGLERGLVLELAVVHELADRWPGGGRHLDQVEVGLLCQPERIIQSNDPHLLAVWTDKPYLGNPDALVNTGFDADVTSLGYFSSRPTQAGTSDHPCRGLRTRAGCPHTQKAPHIVHAEPTNHIPRPAHGLGKAQVLRPRDTHGPASLVLG